MIIRKLLKGEMEALMDCVAVTKKAIKDKSVNIPNLAMARLKNVNLNGLWNKIFEASNR